MSRDGGRGTLDGRPPGSPLRRNRQPHLIVATVGRSGDLRLPGCLFAPGQPGVTAPLVNLPGSAHPVLCSGGIDRTEKMQYCSIYGITAVSWRHAGWRCAQAGTGPRNARSGAHAAADTRAAIRVNRPASTSGRPRTDEPPHGGPARPGMPAPGLPDLVAITGQFHCPLIRGKGQSPVKACTSVVWLPVRLPNDRKGAGIRMPSCAPSRTRTYGLLLRRQSLYPLSYRGLPRP